VTGLPRKLAILSSRSENLGIVLERLVYGADVHRPEQRGLLSLEEGDIAFLYDIANRRLIGPFRVRGDIFYSSERLWEKEWPFRVSLEPAGSKVGVLEGRRLLDALIASARLSLRGPSALEQYWIHPIILSEASNLYRNFVENASYKSLEAVGELYGVQVKAASGVGGGESLWRRACADLTRGSSEWPIEALVTRKLYRRLITPLEPMVRINGLYVYYRRYVDAVIINAAGEVVVAEVKKSIGSEDDLRKAVDQAMYYSYAISKGFNISESLIYPVVVVASPIREQVRREAPRVIEEASSKYNLRADKASVVEVKAYCSDGNLEYKIMKIL
jgi:hypothetical protein